MLLSWCLWKCPDLFIYGNRTSELLFFHHEQTSVNMVYLVIWGYIPVNTCVLHLVNLTFRGLTSLHSLQVNFVLSCPECLFLSTVSLPSFPYIGSQTLSGEVSHPGSLPKYLSLLPFFQSGQASTLGSIPYIIF